MQMRVLSEEDVQRIHEAALLVLERTGIWFHDCPQAIGLLGKSGCRVDGERVFFSKEAVAEGLARVPDRNVMRFALPHGGLTHDIGLKQGESHVALIGNALEVYDFDKGSSRACVPADDADKFRVLSSLENFELDFCGMIRGADQQLSGADNVCSTVETAVDYLHIALGDRAGRSPKQLRLPQAYCRDARHSRLDLLALIILQGEEAVREHCREVNAVWCNPISPLQFHPDQARWIMEVARDPRPLQERWILISPEVMMGATGPVTLAGALVQHNAEVLAGTVLANMACAGAPVTYGCVSAPMDLRNAQISHGKFETAFFNAAVVQLADRYGMPSRISPGNTCVKAPTTRAAVETAVGLYMGLAAGGNIISTGLLDSTVMLSYEHLIVVNELVNQIRSVTGGLRMDAEALALDAISEHGHPSPGYIYSNHTLENMNRDVYYSDFCGRVEASCEDWYARAHRQVKELLIRDDIAERTDAEALERLASVEARLRQDDKTWRSGGTDWWRFYVQEFV